MISAHAEAPVPSERERQDWRIRTLLAAFMAEPPTICPRCGGRDLIPVLATDRRSWLCLDCKRERRAREVMGES